jgi:RNA polymerase sigma-70 factor (ECF subfamily)
LASADAIPQVVFDSCRRGESGSFTEIYQRFAGVVHGIVLAAIGRQDAEDVTQDVFMKVHRSIATVLDREALPGWICTVARNAARDHGRKRLRREGTRPLHLVDEPAAGTAAEHTVDHGELGEQVLALVRGLPTSYRETLILRLVEGLTGPEIAERTGMTHGSVRVNLSRGMAQLRPLLAKKGWS